MPIVHSDTMFDDPVSVHSFGNQALGMFYQGAFATAPAGGGNGTNTARFIPFYLNKPYKIARWFWCNGGTVGTDYQRVAIHERESWRVVAASPRTLSAGANVAQYANPGPSGIHVTETQSSTDATNYNFNDTTIYLKKGWLYLLVVENSHGSDASAVSAITAGSTSWTSRSTVQFNGTLNRISIWSCVPTADYMGTVNVAFGGVTQTGMCGSISAVPNVDTATNDGIVQAATGTGNSTTPLATLSAFGSANNMGFGGIGLAGLTGAMGPVTTATSEIAELSTATPAQVHAAAFSYNDTTFDYTVTSGQWGICALEIKADTSAFWIPAGRYYMSLQTTGGTAQVFRKVTWTEVTGTYVRSTGGIVFAEEAPTSQGGSGSLPVFGFTRRATP